ncbi:MAG: plasmid stabilization protein [Candidatus Eisenbacteria bacterium]
MDGLIAATAIRHGLHVMTRNLSDFRPTGALLIDPWSDAVGGS